MLFCNSEITFNYFQITTRFTMNNLTVQERHSLILSNLNLADKIAKSKKRKLSHISLDDLKSAAYLGLVEAANSYNSLENDCFPAYAVWRIIGAVKDFLRELSWGSRSKPVKMAVLQDDQISKKNKEQFDFDEIISSLSDLNKSIFKLYYQEGFKLKEIADSIGVHESRISQILSDSRLKLRKSLAEEYSFAVA